MLSQKIEIESWNAQWQMDFRQKATAIRDVLGERALRIDHIGSTSVERLAAKPIIDIQISVLEFEPFDPIVSAMAGIGYCWRPKNPDLSKRYFREDPGNERTHIHMRHAGSWHEQWALLFRDYMRTHPEEHQAYVDLKRALANEHHDNRLAYTEGKDDYFWQTIRRADRWASDTGWLAAFSDA